MAVVYVLSYHSQYSSPEFPIVLALMLSISFVSCLYLLSLESEATAMPFVVSASGRMVV